MTEEFSKEAADILRESLAHASKEALNGISSEINGAEDDSRKGRRKDDDRLKAHIDLLLKKYISAMFDSYTKWSAEELGPMLVASMRSMQEDFQNTILKEVKDIKAKCEQAPIDAEALKSFGRSIAIQTTAIALIVAGVVAGFMAWWMK